MTASALLPCAIGVRSQLHGSVESNLAITRPTRIVWVIPFYESVCKPPLCRGKVSNQRSISMNRFSIIKSLILILILSSQLSGDTPNDKSTVIPLDKIWASRMPGTIDLWKIDDTTIARAIISMQRALSKPRPKGKDAEAAFVVHGTGLKAVHEAHGVLVDGKKPRDTIPKGSEASIVFFSHEFGRYVHLDSVSRGKDHFTIRFKFVPHATKELSAHFALIPLGNCPSRKTRVEIVQLPMDKVFIDEGWKPVSSEIVQRIVCHPVSFVCEGAEGSKNTSSQKH